MKYFFYVLCGCIIGVANIIPGVSGGTMAVILNVYDKLIDAFVGLRKHFKESIKLLIPIAVGAGAGILGFAKLLSFLLASFPMPTFFFFIGLIVGSVPLVARKALETRFRPISLIPFVVFFGIMITFAFIGAGDKTAASSQMELNLFNWLYLFFGSALAAMSMIIPGVSGSMVLMILGLYSYVLKAVADLLSHDFLGSCMILLPAGLGIVVGIVGGAKLMDLCIKKYPQMTFFGIIGLMLGSVLSVYNNAGFEWGTQGIIAIGALAVGFAISLLFGSEKLKERFSVKQKISDSSENKQENEITDE